MNKTKEPVPPLPVRSNVGLCNNLKFMREKCGYSLQELGDMCGRSKAQIWELEKTSSNPTLKTAYALSKVLGVEVTDIWPNTVEIVEETITVRRVVHNMI